MSINLDNWTPEQIEHFRKIGNKRANEFFNPQSDRHPPPRSDRDVERYIRDKYERRLFVDSRNNISDPTVSDDEDDGPAEHAPQSPAGGVDEASALTRMREMGFSNVRDNHAALKRFGFNVDAAVAYLRGETAAPARPKISVADPRVKQLLNMGFDHAGQNVQALTLCNGDVTQAIELLLSDKPPPRTSAVPEPSAKSPPPPKPVSKSPAAAVSSAAAASNLLDGDFFGAAPSSSSNNAPKTSSNLNDLLGNMSLAAGANSGAQPSRQQQETKDALGDFGEFISAPTSPPPTSGGIPSMSPPPQQQPNHGGQSIFDNDFIMSLYSKGPVAATPGNSSTASQPKTKDANNAFGDLDFFL
ncbi:Gtpase activating protein [Coemansia sp. RSA 2322]|nr:Gtpase activating protein [Coemansia sp. RSA 2322]